jgi:mannose-6-phosphate isomerase-like protein (cupin superfamily)
VKSTETTPQVRIIGPRDERPTLPLVDGNGTACAIVWPGIGAVHRSMHRIALGHGSATVCQRHQSEAVYFVTVGTAEVRDVDAGETTDLRVGSMVHVDAGTGYVFVAGPEGAEIIGGPCPPDPALYTSRGD